MALTLPAEAAWDPTKNRVEYPLPPRRPPLDRTRSPTGGSDREPPPTPPTAAQQGPTPRGATATSGPPPPESPRARPDHEAARRGAQNEAARVRKEQDARRHRQERYHKVPGGATKAAATKHGPERFTPRLKRDRQPHRHQVRSQPECNALRRAARLRHSLRAHASRCVVTNRGWRPPARARRTSWPEP